MSLLFYYLLVHDMGSFGYKLCTNAELSRFNSNIAAKESSIINVLNFDFVSKFII